MHCARAWRAGQDLVVKKCLKAKGRDERVFISLASSLATSVAEAPFVFRFFFPRPEPANCS